MTTELISAAAIGPDGKGPYGKESKAETERRKGDRPLPREDEVGKAQSAALTERRYEEMLARFGGRKMTSEARDRLRDALPTAAPAQVDVENARRAVIEKVRRELIKRGTEKAYENVLERQHAREQAKKKLRRGGLTWCLACRKAEALCECQ